MSSSSSGSPYKKHFKSVRAAMKHIVHKAMDQSASLAPPLSDEIKTTVSDVPSSSSSSMTSSTIMKCGDANLVPAYDRFVGSFLSSRRIRERLESQLREGDVFIGKVESVDVAGAKVRLIAGVTKRVDLRDMDMKITVLINSLGIRPRISEYIRVAVDLLKPLKFIIHEEAKDSITDSITLPKYIIDDTSYSEWTTRPDNRIMLNRHAEEAVGAAGQATVSFLPEVMDAEKSYRTKRQQKQDQARDLVSKGIAAMHNKEPDEAWTLLREAAEIYPPCADAYVAMGALLANDGRNGESEKYFQRALSYEPKHKNARLYYTQVLFVSAQTNEKDGRWMAAIELYEKAIQANLDVESAKEKLERCRKELNAQEERRKRKSPSIEEIPKVDSSAKKRPRISEGRRRASSTVSGDGQVASSVSDGRSSSSSNRRSLPVAQPLMKEQLETLAALNALHESLKNESENMKKMKK